MALNVYLSIPERLDLPVGLEGLMERAALAALETEGISEAEVSVALLRDGPIQKLNRKWRGHDWAPDVLSFGLHNTGEPPVGDVYVGADQAARQAAEHGVRVREELLRLVIHGVLHVLGYDHPENWRGKPDCELYRKQELILETVLAGDDESDSPGSTVGNP